MERAILLLAVVASSICLAHAQAVSTSIEPPDDTALLLTAKGDGVQIYACTDGRWTLKGPDANLLDSNGKVIGTHFAGPTWHINSGGEVKGKVMATKPSPDASSVPWLLLQAVPGSASGKLANVIYIGRTETHGGASPKETCETGELRVPYTAQYSFYVAK